jgi:hypothetical protein
MKKQPMQYSVITNLIAMQVINVKGGNKASEDANSGEIDTTQE